MKTKLNLPAVGCFSLALLAASAAAQSYQPIYSFTAGPLSPRAGLVQGPDGNFYGTSASGGSNDVGTVFKVTTNGTVTTLYSFSAGGNDPLLLSGKVFTNSDGAVPEATLTLGSDGNFYGTTSQGGINGFGTAFQLTTNGTLTTLVSFSYEENQGGGLTFGSDGNLYGTSEYGGYGYGWVFAVSLPYVGDTNYSDYSVRGVYNFTGGNDGEYPLAGLTLGPDGNVYGTTSQGGTNGYGTVFRVVPNFYSSTLTTLASLDSTNGVSPNALTLGPDGNFYGTSSSVYFYFSGGGTTPGAIFQVSTNGNLTTLDTFGGPMIGSGPQGPLALGLDGNFYFLADNNVFKMTTNGSLTMLDLGAPQGSLGGLTLGSDGNFYGTTTPPNDSGGTVFQITTNGEVATLANFSYMNGVNPSTALTLGPDNNFYGTTKWGGTNDFGTLFRVTTNGTFDLLFTFKIQYGDFDTLIYNTNGGNPNALMLGPDGNLYGTTSSGGGTNDGSGTVFKMTTNGTLTTLYSFSASDGVVINGNYVSTNSDGAYPEAGLTLGPDGNFYGTTSGGGTNGAGTLFEMTTNGVLTTFYTFAALVSNGNENTNSDGAQPSKGLTFGLDGNLYGTTSTGGIYSYGTIFKVTTNGVFSTLTTFTNWTSPNALTLGPDGNFYGTTEMGGSNYDGTVFEMTTNGTLSTLHFFTAPVPNGNDSTNYDGAQPTAGLTLGPDGNFYGTTTFGGSNGGTIAGGGNGGGTVFQITTNGTLTTLYSFGVTPNWLIGGNFSGWGPEGGVTLGSDGNFYGTAYGGGNGGGGVIYRLNLLSALLNSPASQVVATGGNATFTASLAGNGNYNYQWLSNNIPIVGATNSMLTVSNAMTGSTINYSVVVADGYGSITSSVAMLTAVLPPAFSQAARIANGGLTLNLTTSTNVSSRIYATTNLVPPFVWQPIYTNANGGAWQFTDTNAAVYRSRFYRVSTP